jgi:predicted GIY-YIG superfamily endonuclease
MSHIYVLELVDSKYYVGKTNNINVRFKQHFTGRGAYWTKKYKPVRILETSEMKSSFDEDNKVKEYMKLHGVNNVRGGSYCKIKLDLEQVNLIEREIRSSNDECLKCGKKGHFIKNCNLGGEKKKVVKNRNLNCIEDRKTDFGTEMSKIISSAFCNILTKFVDDIFIQDSCFRCGRRNHSSEKCYAKRNIQGELL